MSKELYIDLLDDWAAADELTIPENALVGGYDGEDLYVGRAVSAYGCSGSLIPGKTVFEFILRTKN